MTDQMSYAGEVMRCKCGKVTASYSERFPEESFAFGDAEGNIHGSGYCLEVSDTHHQDNEGHVLKVTMGEFTRYTLTCNLDDTAQCHQVCRTHPEGSCGDPDNDTPCRIEIYENGCTVAEWVNDGGIESVEFEHVLNLPVTYRWDGEHDYPTITVVDADAQSIQSAIDAGVQA